MQFLLNTKIGAETQYVLRSAWQDLKKQKFGTFLTILVIAASLTIPTVSYLLWKNTRDAALQFYPEPEITIYLNKNLSEHDITSVVDSIRRYNPEQVENVQYISRQQSLDEFRSWSGFGEALEILEDNPLPAVVLFKPKREFNDENTLRTFRDGLQQIKGVEEVRLDNGWLAKLTALNWLIARIGIVCTILMLFSVFLVISTSVRSDVSKSQSSIEAQQLLGATDHFIARPFLYKGMFYGVMGSFVAILFSSGVIGYFTGVVKYVTDIFTVKFELHGVSTTEGFFLVVFSLFLGWLSAKIATNRYIQRIGARY